jgi:hypothetical protein
MSNSTLTLIELRRHYENIVSQSEYQVAQAKEQLAHIDAQLVNGILQAQELPVLETTISPTLKPASPIPVLSAQAEASETRTELEPDEDVEDFLARAKPSSSRKAAPAAAPVAQGNRIPRPLLPAYQGLKRLEAIAQVLQSTPSQEVTIDSLSQALFGDLIASDRALERKRLYTLLYQGEKRGLWEKGKSPYSYLMGDSKTTEDLQTTPQVSEPESAASVAKTSSAIAPHQESATRRGQDSLSLLPAYAGMNKLEAIAQVLTEQSGYILHQDTLFQLLYGEVSPEVLSKESKRMRASLFQGVTKGLWEKASNRPSSYLVKASNGRQPKASANAKAEGVSSSIVAGEPKPPSATQAKASTSAKIAQLEPATPKKPRKAAPAETTAKPKRKQAEVVALLKKANIKV